MERLLGISICMAMGGAGGLLGSRLNITGGAIIGAMIAVIASKVIMGGDLELPGSYTKIVQIMVGIMIGASCTSETLHLVKQVALPIIISTLILVITGILISLVFAKLGVMDSATAYLSTSPGAMSALISIAGEKCQNPPVVLAFHFFRIVFIIITAPVVFHFLRKWFGSF